MPGARFFRNHKERCKLQVIYDVYFWLSILLLALTDFFFVITFLKWFDFGFVVGQHRFNHWLDWLDFLFVLIQISPFYITFFTLKLRYVAKIKYFLGIHVLGNLSTYLVITIHFAGQISRSSQVYPDSGTGLALYIFMITLVTKGFLQ